MIIAPNLPAQLHLWTLTPYLKLNEDLEADEDCRRKQRQQSNVSLLPTAAEMSCNYM